MALEVEWALSRSSVLLVNSLARSKSECLNFNALGALVAQPNRLQNRLFLVNVTKPVGRLRASPGSGVRGRVRRTGANDPVGRHAVWRAGLRNHRPARRGRLGSRRPSAADRRAVSSAARGPLYLRSAGPGDSPRQCASDGRRHPLGLAAGAAFARGAADRTPLRAEIYLDDWLSAPVYDFDALAPAQIIAGPAIVESAMTTVLLRPGERATLTPLGWLDIAVNG